MKATISLKQYRHGKPVWVEIVEIRDVDEFAVSLYRPELSERWQTLQDFCRAISAVFDVPVKLRYNTKDVIIDVI